VCTLLSIMNKAAKVSLKDFPDEVVVVYEKTKGEYAFSLETFYTGETDIIRGRYLNGKLVAT
jgi:hypothetical protein